MPNRLGVYVSPIPGFIKPAFILDIRIGAVSEGPALPVSGVRAVLKDLGTIRIQKPGLRKLLRSLSNYRQRPPRRNYAWKLRLMG